MLRKITAREYRENHQGSGAYVDTFNGRERIDYIDKNFWAHCPDANAGFGLSFSLHPGSEVLLAVDQPTSRVHDDLVGWEMGHPRRERDPLFKGG